jgi:Cullin family/Cullin protein neddylation domain
MIGHCAFALVASDRFRTQSIAAVSCNHPSSINLSSYATHIVSLIVLRALSTAYRRPRPRAPAAAASDAAAFASTPRAHRRRSRAANAPAAMDSGIIDLDSGWNLIETRGFKPLAQTLDSGGDYRARHGATGLSEWSTIYTTVYNMCTQRPPHAFAEHLYARVQTTLSAYLSSSTLPALTALYGEFMLRELGRRWSNHKLMVRWVTRTFSYLDRYYVKRHEQPSLEHVGYMCFKETVFDAISQQVRAAALNIVCRERDGETVDRALLKAVLGIFAEMGMGKLDVYTDEWESPFLESTAEFYKRASARWADDDSFPDFMRKADACIMEERERAEQYLNSQTKERLQRVCEKELLTEHQQVMLEKENSGLVALLENNKRDDLKLLYKLYFRVQNGLAPVGQILKNHIRKEGMELVREQRSRIETQKSIEKAEKQDASDRAAALALGNSPPPPSATATASSDIKGPDFIQSLLALHDKYLDLVTNCFERHQVFNKAMKEAFERFVNEQVGDSSTAQLFANFCDSLLNSGGVGAKMNETDIESQLEKLVKLFTFLSEKDVYQEFCRKQLAKRLLLDRSHSDDAERFLIGKLKQSCGSHFTSKLEGMITDMNVSRDTQADFHKWNIERISTAAAIAADPEAAAAAAARAAADAAAAVTRDGAAAGPIPGAPGTSITPVATPVPTTPAANAAYAEAMAGIEATGSACVVEGVDFSVRVLTTVHWPTYTEDKMVLPPQIEMCTNHFRNFYNSRTSQRLLRWVYSLGKATLETRMFVGKKPYSKIELHVSTHQMCILLMFNDTDSLTYEDVWEAIRSKAPRESKDVPSGEELVKTSMLSLTTKRYPLLIKEPRGREVRSTDAFTLNSKFISSRKRLSIPMPTAKISEEEKEAAHETVVEDRRHAIEAAIVRVMKQHKVLMHQSLVMEVSKLCNPVFKPEPRAIKSRIEELINREYLAREEGSSSSYKYLA